MEEMSPTILYLYTQSRYIVYIRSDAKKAVMLTL